MSILTVSTQPTAEIQPDFMDHYLMISDAALIQTIDEARQLAGGDENRIWFVRGGDGGYDLDSLEQDADGNYYDEDGTLIDEDDLEDKWDVEIWDGQFVNCLGFFVTVEPCRDEHRETIFTY